MRPITCDVAVIGAGTAGLAAREAAVEAGARAVLIEQGLGGTTCARTGCMPSKLLIAAAAAAHAAGRLDLFGLRLEGRIAVDREGVMARLRRERDRFVGSVLESVAQIPDAERLHGTARFLGPTTLAVGEEARVTARAVVIATGSRSAMPDALKPLGDLVLTSETVFELPTLPGSLAVIGAGPLGIELAQAFARLGVRVAVLDEGEAVAGLADPAVGEAARRLLGREVELVLGATLEAKRVDDGAALSWSTKGGERGSATFERMLAAAGRPPNFVGLDLGKAGIALDRHGVPDFDRATMRCGESAIFIAGDADRDRPVLHEAAEEGRIAGRNAARCPEVERSDRQVPLAIAYTDPEIAAIGARWGEIAHEAAVGEADLSQSGRARAIGRDAGLLRVYGRRRDGKLLGGAMIGPQVEHLAHLLAWCIQLGLTADEALALPFYHPTLEESLRAALRSLCAELRTRPTLRAGPPEYGPGG